jgi:dTDP-4-dehydrorhamnose reductase
MKAWLAGAEGTLGSILRARLEGLGCDFVATGRALDIADLGEVSRFVDDEQPTLIVNAAAYTRVDEAETHAEAAFRANALGPENLGRLAVRSGARVLHFSTDYVFDGRASEPYREDADTAPLGVYARTKREGEKRLLEVTGGRGVILVRGSWMFAGGGPSFVQRILDLVALRDEVRVVIDQRGRPTYAADFADAALRLAGLVEPDRHPESARPDGVYHFANRGEVTRHAFAEAILERARALGLPVRASRIAPVPTSDYPLAAARPRYCVLATEKIEAALGIAPRPWQAALDDFFSARAAAGARAQRFP